MLTIRKGLLGHHWEAIVKVDSYGNNGIFIVVAVAILIPRKPVIFPIAKWKKFDTCCPI